MERLEPEANDVPQPARSGRIILNSPASAGNFIPPADGLLVRQAVGDDVNPYADEARAGMHTKYRKWIPIIVPLFVLLVGAALFVIFGTAPN
jgi:hypothetical protein